ncbi:MAG: hypothetical protein ACXABY_07025 [Candidatus Thorarchaeota archaeon]
MKKTLKTVSDWWNEAVWAKSKLGRSDWAEANGSLLILAVKELGEITVEEYGLTLLKELEKVSPAVLELLEDLNSE